MSRKAGAPPNFIPVIEKIIKTKAPKVKAKREDLELLSSCALSYAKLLIGTAAEITEQHQKVQTNGDYVLEAIHHLGFTSFEEPTRALQKELTDKVTAKRQMVKERKATDLTYEERVALQKKLYEEAVQASKQCSK